MDKRDKRMEIEENARAHERRMDERPVPAVRQQQQSLGDVLRPMFLLPLVIALLSITVVGAQNQVIINFGVSQSGGFCALDSQCVSNLCLNSTCVSCTANSSCASNLCLNSTCVSCSVDGNCSSNLCSAGVCTACTNDSSCSGSTNYCLNGACSSCSSDLACSSGLCSGGICLGCSKDADCNNTGFPCISGTCKACTSDVQCAFGVCQSGGKCTSCTDVGCPNNWNCNNATGRCSCRNQGQQCGDGNECCSGACRAGVCATCIIDQECPAGNICSDMGLCVQQSPLANATGNVTGNATTGNATGGGNVTTPPVRPPSFTPGFGGPSSSSVSSSSYSSSVQITREEQRQAAAPFIFALFGVSKRKVEASATCVRGSLCSSSLDCCGAECSNGACLCAMGGCVTSGECCVGYCEKGVCKGPPQTSLFISESLNRPVTSQFGCTGLIEECDPSETQCVSICDGLTGVLALVSFGFGGYVWRSLKHPVPGLVAAFMPVFIGMLTYPFVGIVIGVVMLGLLLVK